MRHRLALRRALTVVSVAAAGALLSACAGLGADTTASTSGAAPAPASPNGPAAAQALAGFQDRQRASAEAAEQQGQWAQAAWAWESLLAVRPGDTAVAARLQKAQQAADSRATLLAQQARLSLQLGDPDGARELLLRALAALPTHAEAIDGLRALEDTRVRRQFVEPDPLRAALPRTAAARSAAEFASLLVAQGEAARAAEWLLPLATGRQADPAIKRQLSDVFLLMAEAQRGTDPAAALATVRRSLQMDPRNTRAGSKLREWQQRPAPAATRAPASPQR